MIFKMMKLAENGFSFSERNLRWADRFPSGPTWSRSDVRLIYRSNTKLSADKQRRAVWPGGVAYRRRNFCLLYYLPRPNWPFLSHENTVVSRATCLQFDHSLSKKQAHRDEVLTPESKAIGRPDDSKRAPCATHPTTLLLPLRLTNRTELGARRILARQNESLSTKMIYYDRKTQLLNIWWRELYLFVSLLDNYLTE